MYTSDYKQVPFKRSLTFALTDDNEPRILALWGQWLILNLKGPIRYFLAEYNVLGLGGAGPHPCSPSQLQTIPVHTLSHSLMKPVKPRQQETKCWDPHNLHSCSMEIHNNNDQISKGYLYVSELGCEIGVVQYTGAQECNELDAEFPVQALIHDMWRDTEWQPASKDRVSSLTPASFFHALWRPFKAKSNPKHKYRTSRTNSDVLLKR